MAMTVGLALGMGSIILASIITIISSILVIVLSKINLFNNNTKMLKIVVPDSLNYNDIFKEELEKYTINYQLEQVKTTNMGSLFELTYYLTLKKGADEISFINDLRVKNDNLKLMLSQNINNDL